MARHREAIVYRIEDDAGDGPFSGGDVRDAHRAAYGDTYRHDPYEMPTPMSSREGDVFVFRARHSEGCRLPGWARFAFPLKRTMRRYFKPALLRERGYRLSVYRVEVSSETYAESASQCVFDTRSSRLERVEPLK